MDDNELRQYIDYLVEKGAMIPTGEVSEGGEPFYIFNAELMSLYAPEVWASILEETDQELLKLYNLGLVNIEYDENLEAHFTLTDLGREIVELDKGN